MTLSLCPLRPLQGISRRKSIALHLFQSPVKATVTSLPHKPDSLRYRRGNRLRGLGHLPQSLEYRVLHKTLLHARPMGVLLPKRLALLQTVIPVCRQ